MSDLYMCWIEGEKDETETELTADSAEEAAEDFAIDYKHDNDSLDESFEVVVQSSTMIHKFTVDVEIEVTAFALENEAVAI